MIARLKSKLMTWPIDDLWYCTELFLVAQCSKNPPTFRLQFGQTSDERMRIGYAYPSPRLNFSDSPFSEDRFSNHNYGPTVSSSTDRSYGNDPSLNGRLADGPQSTQGDRNYNPNDQYNYNNNPNVEILGINNRNRFENPSSRTRIGSTWIRATWNASVTSRTVATNRNWRSCATCSWSPTRRAPWSAPQTWPPSGISKRTLTILPKRKRWVLVLVLVRI